MVITIKESKLLGHAAMVGGDDIFNWQAYRDLDIMCSEHEVLVHTDKHWRSQENLNKQALQRMEMFTCLLPRMVRNDISCNIVIFLYL